MVARPRVTAVNDNPEFLELVGEILREDHYAVTLIDSDKPEALATIKASQPDILMLDLRLGSAGLRGWDVLQAVRGDPDLTELPVLLCSGDFEAMERVESDLGSMTNVGTLRKPLALDQLSDAISHLLDDPGSPPGRPT